eukprot:1490860-Pleurochrysis_carterae.AAC.1
MKLACAPHAIRDHVAYTVSLLVKRAIARWCRATSAVVRTATVSEVDTRLYILCCVQVLRHLSCTVVEHDLRSSRTRWACICSRASPLLPP